MKTRNRHLSILSILVSGLSLMPANQLPAQSFTTLHSFASAVLGPTPELTLSNSTLYGIENYGGASSNGAIFALKTDGSGFTNLYSFTATSSPDYTNRDGGGPLAGLLLSGNTLYGTTVGGGVYGLGTVFAINTNGMGFTNLHSFTALSNNTNNDGANPAAGLVLSSNTLYGTTYGGGSFGNGAVFAVNTNGTEFTNLYSFTALNNNTNTDGAKPFARLVLSGNILYGTTYKGGSFGNGTVFAINTDGSGFTNLHSFSALNNNTNSDGANPHAGLVLSANTLYGTTYGGGGFGSGTVFAINTDGTDFTNLHSFTAISVPFIGTNSDGANPTARLALQGNTLYGTTHGGIFGNGTVFAVSTDGTDFTTLYSFTASNNGTNSDGSFPDAGLIYSSYTLYGTSYGGGNFGSGTVFSLSFLPQLTINELATNVILAWPTNVAGFDYAGFALQATTNLAQPVIWNAVTFSPAVVNGQNIVTNPMSDEQMFYRLSQ